MPSQRVLSPHGLHVRVSPAAAAGSGVSVRLLQQPGVRAIARARGVGVYTGCELFRARDASGPVLSARGKGAKRDRDNGSGDDGRPAGAGIVYMKVNASDREPTGAYALGDIWIISSDGLFAPGDTTIACSAFRAISNRDMMRLDDFAPRESACLPPLRRRLTGAVALRGPNISSEIAMLRTLAAWAEGPPLIARALASYCSRPALKLPRIKDGVCDATLARIMTRFKLNADQASVIQNVIGWFRDSGALRPPITLVHGVFGAGKTSTLVAMIIALCTLLDEFEGRTLRGPSDAPIVEAGDDVRAGAVGSSCDSGSEHSVDVGIEMGAGGEALSDVHAAAPAGNELRRLIHKSAQNVRQRGSLGRTVAASQRPPPKIRILVASLTNTAVDTILLGLQRAGFNDFARVGSLPRIAKQVLPHVMHNLASAPQRAAAITELEEMLEPTKKGGECASGSGDGADSVITEADRAAISAALRIVKSDNDALRELTRTRVIGVTCAAASSEALDGVQCDVCVMDECSQMVEPLSLVPIARVRAGLVVAVGDPMQLPPQIASRDEHHPLRVTMFDRLARIGYEVTQLRTQYRCHPAISAVANRLFYNGNLIDGVTAAARSACVRGLPPVSFHNVEDSHERVVSGGSFVNEAEAISCVRLTAELLHRGMRASDIGVIALYRAQAVHIRCRLRAASAVGICGIPAHADLSRVLVSTVDAFQGAEREVIIVSCCRSTNVGFTDSPNRLNVTLTRARRHLVMFGFASALRAAPLWRDIIDAAEYVSVRSGDQSRGRPAGGPGGLPPPPVAPVGASGVDAADELAADDDYSLPAASPRSREDGDDVAGADVEDSGPE